MNVRIVKHSHHGATSRGSSRHSCLHLGYTFKSVALTDTRFSYVDASNIHMLFARVCRVVDRCPTVEYPGLFILPRRSRRGLSFLSTFKLKNCIYYPRIATYCACVSSSLRFSVPDSEL